VTSQVHPQQHKQPTNTTTMVMEPLVPPAALIQQIHAVRVAGGLALYFLRSLLKGLVQFNKLM
jgi:hypothetical protein